MVRKLALGPRTVGVVERETPKPVRKSAGLPLSVGSAPLPLRIFIAAMFLTIGVLCMTGGAFLGARGPVAAKCIAVALIIPLGLIACIGAAFTIAPFSRFGVWLDHFLPTMTGVRAAAVAVLMWIMATLLLAIA